MVGLCAKYHCPGIAYTYTEPLTYIEYVTDIARLAHEKGLWNILVTAGYVNQEPLADLLPYLDAANIDLKSFSDDIYQRISGGRLSVVLNTILTMKKAGVWIELTNLVIPGINDDLEMIRRMCRWMVEIGMEETPLLTSVVSFPATVCTTFLPRLSRPYVMPDRLPWTKDCSMFI